jgi:hypothetical protein
MDAHSTFHRVIALFPSSEMINAKVPAFSSANQRIAAGGAGAQLWAAHMRWGDALASVRIPKRRSSK